MNDKSNNKKIKNANNVIVKPPPIYKTNFSTESEIIIRFIIEKIISLSITESLKNKIDKIIPEYCFKQIFQALDIIMHLDFISYDKDDFPIKPKYFLKKINSSINLNKKIKLDIPNELKEMENSEIIRKYKLDKEYDPNVLDSFDINFSMLETSRKEENTEISNKKILNILNRESDNDINNSFQKSEIKKEKYIEKYNKKINYNFREDKNKIIKELYSSNNTIPEKEKYIEPFKISQDEKIDEIKKTESHKVNINLNEEQNIYSNNKKSKLIPFEKIVESTNFWNNILQPNSAPIDRDAGTKIKFEKPPMLKISKKLLPKTIKKKKKIISKESKIYNKEENNSNENENKKTKKLNFSNRLSNSQNRKKKKIIELPFEATDVDPKKLETYKELDEIALLRDKVEKDIQEKKKEKELLAKIEKEKKLKSDALEEMRKELYKKNVTVDAKGEIVFIKPIDLTRLIEEFNKGRANFKNIKVFETDSKYHLTNNEIKVEKNPDDLIKDDVKEEKNKKKKKKLGFSQKNSISINSNITNIRDGNKKKTLIDKGAKYISGSNFAIINPEIGVDITEDEKKKSGGKDYYKKYNRFSIEVFQEQLSKTSKNFFPKTAQKTDVIFETNETNKTDRILNHKKTGKILDYRSKSKNIINSKIFPKNNNEKNSLSLKTKNLKIALQDLDLVNEREMNNLNTNKKFKKSFILSKILNNTKNNINNLNDMNKFAKTLVGKENWGAGAYTERKNNIDYKLPKKPENIELQRELPLNMMKHMPRKRLPPLNTSIRLNTLTGFFTDRTSKKSKEKKSVNKEDKKK